MSIVALKRKTQAQTGLSHGTGFYLNGTRRSQGYVGQTDLSRHFTHTLMRHGAPMGHGGCCNTFPVHIQGPAVTSLENPNVVKTSTMNTSGLISTKYRWAKRGRPFTTVKPNANNQADYIDRLKKTSIAKCDISKKNSVVYYGACRNCATANSSGQIFSKSCIACKSTTAPIARIGAMDQSEHIIQLHKTCAPLGVHDTKNANKGTPFACK